MNVLLNIAQNELASISGDITYLNSLRNSTNERMHFSILPGKRNELTRMFWARIYGAIDLPYLLRRKALLESKRVSIPSNLNGHYDILHTHLLFPRLKRKKSIPLVWSSQGIFNEWYEFYGRHDFREVYDLYRQNGRIADAIISWTSCGAEGIASITTFEDSKIFVVPPFIDGASGGSFVDPYQNKRRILFVGLDPYRKGLFDLLEACRLVRKVVPDIIIDVVSQIDEKEVAAYQDLAVNLYGLVSPENLKGLFEQSCIFVLPTQAETFGFVFLEAMAYNRPIVAYDIRPINEIVERDRQGILVEKGDIGGLALAIKTLLGNAELREKITELQIAKVKHVYSKDVVLAKLQSVYEFAIRQHQKKRT